MCFCGSPILFVYTTLPFEVSGKRASGFKPLCIAGNISDRLLHDLARKMISAVEIG